LQDTESNKIFSKQNEIITLNKIQIEEIKQKYTKLKEQNLNDTITTNYMIEEKDGKIEMLEK